MDQKSEPSLPGRAEDLRIYRPPELTESSRLKKAGRYLSRTGISLFGFAAISWLIAFVRIDKGDWGFWLQAGAGLLGLGMCFIMIAQLVFIRAALEPK